MSENSNPIEEIEKEIEETRRKAKAEDLPIPWVLPQTRAFLLDKSKFIKPKIAKFV